MATVSLCMIVKNEEAVLARCLDSIREAVDEIIIVDTGSTDTTKKIAARYTDKIYDFTWIDDFSAARNVSFSKASMEFAMWLDADDIFTDKDRDAFLRLKNSAWENADVVMMRYNTAFDEEGRPVFSYYRERLVRLSIPHTWKGRVHEAIVHSGRIAYAENVAVTHRSVKTAYSDRNLRIYERQLQEGEPFTPRDQFYYGRELYYHGHYGRAGQILEKFLADDEGWAENKIEACKILAYCRLADNGLHDVPNNDPHNATNSESCSATRSGVHSVLSNELRNASNSELHGATNSGPHDALSSGSIGGLTALAMSFLYDLPRAEICCEIGNILMNLQNYRAASFWFELARRIPQDSKSGGFVSADCHGYLPCIQLCVCYYRLGDIKKAEEYNRMAGTYRPLAPAYLYNRKFFENCTELTTAPK